MLQNVNVVIYLYQLVVITTYKFISRGCYTSTKRAPITNLYGDKKLVSIDIYFMYFISNSVPFPTSEVAFMYPLFCSIIVFAKDNPIPMLSSLQFLLYKTSQIYASNPFALFLALRLLFLSLEKYLYFLQLYIYWISVGYVLSHSLICLLMLPVAIYNLL